MRRLSQASAHKSNENTKKEVFSITKVLKEFQLQNVFKQLFITDKVVCLWIECIR